MRLNKKKLAALAMSAVMAASTMSFPAFAEEIPAGEEMVFADEELVVDEAEVLDLDVEEEVQAPEVVEETENGALGGVVESSIKFYDEKQADGTIKYWVTYDADGQTGLKAEATAVDKEAATCTKNKKVQLTATVKADGKDVNLYSKELFEIPDTALGHLAKDKWVEEEITAKRKPASCTQPGSRVYREICPQCEGKEEGGAGVEQKDEIPVVPHTFVGETKVTYKEGNNTKLVDGNENVVPVLVDSWRSGNYTKVTVGHCSMCLSDVRNEETISVPAETAKEFQVVEAKGFDPEDAVNAELISAAIAAGDPKAIDVTKIKLTDCTKDGSFYIQWLDENNAPLYTEDKPVVVPAHHLISRITIEAKNAADATAWENCTKKQNEDGTWTVVNPSCHKAIEYVEKTYCTVEGNQKPIRTVVKTAEPVGKHSLCTAELKDAKKFAESKDPVVYTDIVEKLLPENVATTVKNNVKIETTATCKAAGVTTVTFTCIECKKEVEKVEIQTAKRPHDFNNVATGKVVKEATCTEGGIVEMAKYCKNEGCDAYLEGSKTIVHTNRLKHTNEGNTKDAYIKVLGDKVIDPDAANPIKVNNKTVVGDKNFFGTKNETIAAYIEGKAYTKCKVCGKETAISDDVVLTVVAIQKEDKDGLNGYITVKASFVNAGDSNKVVESTENYTVPYYSSLAAYMGRVNKDPKNGLNKDEDGIYRLYKDDKVQTEFTGLTNYYGGTFYIVEGVLASNVSGLTKIDDSYYYLSHGQVQAKYTGLVKFEGAWFYVTNGKLDTGVNGLVDYQGGRFLFSQGKRRDDVSGLWFYAIDNEWYYLSHGQVQNKFTGVAFYNGAAFYVVNGVLAKNMNDVVTYNGKQFKVTNGRLSSRPIK